jgi:hypothetical protein
VDSLFRRRPCFYLLLDLSDTRELSITGLPYKAVYRIEGDTVHVLTIIHGARQTPR